MIDITVDPAAPRRTKVALVFTAQAVPHRLVTFSAADSGTALEESAADRLADAAANALPEGGNIRLLLTGGEIAAAVCRRLRVDSLRILDAVEEGVPLVRLCGGIADGALAVTKAGGFGAEDSLYRAFLRLTEESDW